MTGRSGSVIDRIRWLSALGSQPVLEMLSDFDVADLGRHVTRTAGLLPEIDGSIQLPDASESLSHDSRPFSTRHVATETKNESQNSPLITNVYSHRLCHNQMRVGDVQVACSMAAENPTTIRCPQRQQANHSGGEMRRLPEGD
jgi:hypothetical protein